MEITAQLKNLRIAPRKVRLVSRLLKGMNAITAKQHLNYMVKASARPLTKLLDSALANAHHNLGLVKENLFIKDIVVNEGPKLVRFRPKGFGSTAPIQKKTSHVKVVLDEKTPGLRVKMEKAAEPQLGKTVPVKEARKEEVLEKKQFPSREKGFSGTSLRREIIGRVGGLGRKFFRRKAV